MYKCITYQIRFYLKKKYTKTQEMRGMTEMKNKSFLLFEITKKN